MIPKAIWLAPRTYPAKKKEAELPLDAFRDFLKSHSARLTNRLAGKGSHLEKLLLRQRKDNLGVIKECYIKLQKKALGLPTKEHIKDPGR